jgi:microcystin-dependent protein
MWIAYTEENPMIGVILEYVTNDAPSNCLPCDGTIYNRVDYPILYSRLDSAFIIDADTFETPDKVGLFSLGSETNIGEVGGEASHTLSAAEMPIHTHQISNGFGPNVALSAVLGAIEGLSPVPTAETTTSSGSGSAHNNMPPYIKVKYCIVAR